MVLVVSCDDSDMETMVTRNLVHILPQEIRGRDFWAVDVAPELVKDTFAKHFQKYGDITDPVKVWGCH